MPKISVDPPAVFFFASLLLFCDLKSTMMLIFCVLCHEAAHLVSVRVLGAKVKSMRINLFGARIELCDPLASYLSEFAIAAAGPIMNILLGALGIIFMKGSVELGFNSFSCVNFSLALVNLLPISSLDGGRMLYSITAYVFGVDGAQRFLHFSTCFVIVLLWVLSVFLWFGFEQNISLFVFCLYLFYNIVIKREY